MLKSSFQSKFFQNFTFYSNFLNIIPARNFGGELISKSETAQVTNPAVRVKKVLSKDISRALRLLKTKYSENEPLFEGLQLKGEKFSPAIQELWRNHLEQTMSLIAIPQKYRPESPIFGLCVNTKCCRWDSEHLNKYSACIRCPKTSDLINLWALFISESKMHEKFNLNSLFHINHVIINEKSSLDYSPKLDKLSLSKVLVSISLQLARSRGYEVACLTSTSPHTAEVASDIGMDLIWEYPYEKILDNELNPIVKLKEPDTHVKVFARKF